MAGAPQNPRFNFPEAEWLNLAPNAQIALGGRRVRSFTVSGNPPPSNTLGLNVFGVLEQPFPTTAAVYIHDIWCLFNPNNAFGTVTVGGLEMGLEYNLSNVPVYRLGVLVLTSLAPITIATAATDRDKLILGSDLIALGDPFTNQLSVSAFMGVTNTSSTATPTVQLTVQIIYTRLDGLTT